MGGEAACLPDQGLIGRRIICFHFNTSALFPPAWCIPDLVQAGELERDCRPRDGSLPREASDETTAQIAQQELTCCFCGGMRSDMPVCRNAHAIGVRYKPACVVHSKCGPCAWGESLVPLCQRDMS